MPRRATEPSDPGEASGIPDTRAPWAVDPPSVCTDGVELSRLIARAQLTFAQAVELAAGVAAEAARRSVRDAGTPGRILVGADGRVVPAATAPGRPPAAGRPVGADLAEIADAARPRARAAGPAAEALLAELDHAVAELPVAGVPMVARMLRDAAGALDRGTVRAEIGALVRAIAADPDQPLGSRAAGVPATPASPARPARTGRRRTVRRRIGAWLLSVLILGGAVLLEVGFLRDHIATDIGLLLDAGRGGSSSSAARTPADPPVAAPAPASAGPVTAVDLRALAPCAPGSSCSVRLLVRLDPGAGQQAVTWTYRIVNRCTGASVAARGGSIAVPAGGQQAAAVTTVPLPALPGLALIAVTQEPAVAASPAVLVGSCPSRP